MFEWFKNFKEAVRERREMRREMLSILQKMQEDQERYVAMSKEEVLALPDEERAEALRTRMEAKADTYEGEFGDCLKVFNRAQTVWLVTATYEGEVNNGGLCQFFVNSSRELAPYVSECLKELGATEHAKLFDTFVKENNIDLHDLRSFIIDDVDEFEQQNERYPFEAFDDAFYELEPIEELLHAYMLKHIEEY